MTEKEFLRLFNDIDDKFIKEDWQDIPSQYPEIVSKPAAAKRFSWVRIAAAASVFVIAAAGGLFALGNYIRNGGFGIGGDITVDSSDSSYVGTTVQSDITTDPSDNVQQQKPVLYETKLNCNGKSYDLRAVMYKIRSDESIDGVTHLDQNYIWGDISLELYLDGELISGLGVFEACYGAGQVGGMPFDKKNLGNDYFRVLNMEQDVLAYITPNSKLSVQNENDGAILNAMLFTVDKEGNLVNIQRYSTEEERKNLGTRPNGDLTTPDGCYFKITPDFDIEPDRLVLHLDRQVKNPWSDNGTVFEPGDISISFDFENYLVTCMDDDYKYLFYYLTDKPEPSFPQFILMDGTYAAEDELIAQNEGEPQSEYTVSVCFGVPFFTPAEDRIAVQAGEWIKLKAGSKIGDFTVVSARSKLSPRDGAADYLPYVYRALVELKGELSCTGRAEKHLNGSGEFTGDIVVTLDRECCEGMFSLQPKIKVINSFFDDFYPQNFEEERIYVRLREGDTGYDELLSALEEVGTESSLRVKLETDSFSLGYKFMTGEDFDKLSILNLNGGNDRVEILE